MSKPDWKDAPEWANWLAMDSDGEWYWFQRRPHADLYAWIADDGEVEFASSSIGWRKRLEERSRG